MDLRRKGRPKPWISKKKGRNTRNMNTGKLVKSFTGGGVGSSFYQTPQWRATSKAVLDRDAVCQWCAALGVIKVANQADHIVPVERCDESGISPYDKSNIVASCRSCNAKRASYEARGIRIDSYDGWVNFLKKKSNEKNTGL